MTTAKLFAVFLIAMLGFLIIGVSVNAITGDFASLAIAAVAIGLLAFGFYFCWAAQHAPELDPLRGAIALSLVAEYITLVGVSAFFQQGGDLPPITSALLNSFTTVISVVIAFYFGGAIVERLALRSPHVSSVDQRRSGTGADE